MMNYKKLSILTAVAAAAACTLTGLVACTNNANANEYTITKAYTETNKEEIPADAVNQVMFAYSDTNATFETKLTLDPAKKTYTLYKAIITDKLEQDNGEMDYAFKGEWEFYGDYVVSESNSNEITLKVPTSGKNSIYYPTVLNYQSIEKQTQGWVDSTENPALLTRFNKWYPSKAGKTVDQPVTLDGKTMKFGEVNLTVPDEGGKEPDEGDEPEVDMSGWGLDENALVAVGAGGKALNFYSDGTYKFVYNFQYGDTLVPMVDEGTWEFAATATSATLTLTVTPDGGEPVVCTGNVDSAGKLALHYVYSANNVITQDFELTYTHWSALQSANS